MRKVVLLCLLLSIAIVGGFVRKNRTPLSRLKEFPKDSYDVKYFTQALDHFDFSNNQVFQQKYLISDKYWGNPQNEGLFNATQSGCRGPIFFYTGNEGAIELFWENTGFVTDYLAPKYGALIVFAEHRYYGTTLPFGNNSFKPGNTKWLSSEQALADYAVLIPSLKSQLNADSCPVVSFGGSYGGMLSGWFRLKYPNVVNGAIAASAPILQFQNTGVTEWVFNQIVTADFANAGCADQIRDAFQLIQKTGNTNQGLSLLTSTFGLCSPLNQASDLINWAEGGLTYEAMIDYPYPNSFLEPVPAWPVKATCKQMLQTLQQTQNLLAAFAAGLGIYYNYTGDQPCYNLTSTATNDLGTLGWDYQSCTEMVMPIASNGTSDMFLPQPWDLNSFNAYCQATWGVTPRPNWVIDYYGGNQTPNGPNIVGSHIVWSNGKLDPWSGGGVRQDVSDTVAVFIEDGAHHLDLRAPNPKDPKSVIDARQIEELYIRQWINEQ